MCIFNTYMRCISLLVKISYYDLLRQLATQIIKKTYIRKIVYRSYEELQALRATSERNIEFQCNKYFNLWIL